MDDEALDFGEAATDSVLVTKCNALNDWLQKLDGHLSFGEYYRENTKDLTIEERIDYNLFAMFAVNSLFWIKLKLQGIDPNSHPIKNHLEKVRTLMQRKQQIVDKKLRPTLNQKAAERFIRNGLWQPKKHNRDADVQPVNKKTKYDD